MQLHGWWHIFAGYATYMHIIFCVCQVSCRCINIDQHDLILIPRGFFSSSVRFTSIRIVNCVQLGCLVSRFKNWLNLILMKIEYIAFTGIYSGCTGSFQPMWWWPGLSAIIFKNVSNTETRNFKFSWNLYVPSWKAFKSAF